MEPNLFKYILRHSRREQLLILAVVLVSQVFYFLSLDLPKTIVNKAIQGEAFDAPDSTAIFLPLSFELPEALAAIGLPQEVVLFAGFPLERVPYLIGLSVLFLVLVLVNGAFKLHINTQKGRMGERMLRRLRYELFDRVLRFPPSHLRKLKPAEVATMVKDEVEPLGGFIGDAFVAPAFLGGQALTALIFIVAQSFWLGGLTIAVLVLQGAIIPRLRSNVLRLGKQRQLTARDLAGRVAEAMEGVTEIHSHDTSNYERADMAGRLGRIFHIRFDIYQWKFAIKFLNNLLAQLTPFFFYLVGGYLAISGRLDIGGLVAVIAAYKDLPGPVKELIDWDQQRQDVQIKYDQVIEQFSPENMMAPDLQALVTEVEMLAGTVAASGLTLTDDSGARVLDGIDMRFEVGERVALLGPEGGGKEALAIVLARLQRPDSGGIKIGERDLGELTEAVTGRRLGYVGPDAYVFATSMRDNLLYGLRHRPIAERGEPPADAQHHARELAEAKRSGNTDLDPAADWTDYAAAGATGPGDINERLIEVLRCVDLEEDIYQLGLRGTIDPQKRPEIAAAVVRARMALRDRLGQPDMAGLVEPFDRERYSRNMSVAENILFGTAKGPEFAAEHFAYSTYVREVLTATDLLGALVGMGRNIAKTMVELFADLPPGHPFFEQFSFIAADDLPEFRTMLARGERDGLAALSEQERSRLMALAAPYIEARHRLGLVDEAMESRFLAARATFAATLPAKLGAAVEFYDQSRFNAAATLQDNILFGRLVHGQAQAAQRVGAVITETVQAQNLRRAVTEAGLDYFAGVAGKRLTAAQRQKTGLARALLKRPDILIVNGATAAFDTASQNKIVAQVLAFSSGRGVLWTLQRANLARQFDRLMVLCDGRLVEHGRVADVDRPGTRFSELLAAE